MSMMSLLSMFFGLEYIQNLLMVTEVSKKATEVTGIKNHSFVIF